MNLTRNGLIVLISVIFVAGAGTAYAGIVMPTITLAGDVTITGDTTLQGDLTCTNCINAADIAADAVQASEIAPGAVGASEIGSNAVGPSEIQGNAVGSSEILDGAVGSADIAPFAVISSKIGNDAVISSKIANDAVGSSAIADGTIQFSDIGQNGCASNQIMKWNGASWVCAVDSGGSLSSFPVNRVANILGVINPGDIGFNGKATCATGDQLISGGYAVGGTAYVRISQPFGGFSNTEWEIWVENPSGGTAGGVTVIAICLDLTP